MASCCSKPLEIPRSCCGPAPGGSTPWLRLGLATLVAGQAMVLGLAVNMSPPHGNPRLVLHAVLAISALAVFLLCGLPLAREVWQQTLARHVGIEQFFLVGILGAFLASLHSSLTGEGAIYYEVVSVLLAIYTLGSLIGQKRREAALAAADALRREFDFCARLDAAGRTERVPVTAIIPGNRVLVRPGEGVPVDGRLVEGCVLVRETPLTGEAFPVTRRAGDRLLAGSHVLDQAAVIEATVSGDHRGLDELIQRVEQARLRPSTLQREADRIVAWFLPAVLVIALIVWVAWTWAAGWRTGLFNALAVLVVACPCAMGLATPIGIWSALNAMAARGLAVASGEFIEKLAAVDTVVFDKTGTLSEEELRLVDFRALPPHPRDRLKRWIAALETRSAHPMARAFHEWHEPSEIKLGSVEAIPGIGIEAVVEDDGTARTVRIGNISLLTEAHLAVFAPWREEARAAGRHSHELFVTVDGAPAGYAVLRERLRASAQATFATLRRMGLELRVMTGDRPESLKGLGVPEAWAGLSPIEKEQRLATMQAEGRKVLYVGDGINDSAALSRAHASLALASGSALAREAADAELCSDDLEAIPAAAAIARAAVRGIRGNLRFALFYNVIGIGLAAGGILHPVIAALLMLASSLTVTWRALRLGESIQHVDGKPILGVM